MAGRSAEFFSQRYREYISFPGVTEGFILPSGVEITQSHGALTEEKKQKSIRNFSFSASSSDVLSGFPIPLSSEIKMRSYSPSRELVAVVRKPAGSENSDSVKDLIEVSACDCCN